MSKNVSRKGQPMVLEPKAIQRERQEIVLPPSGRDFGHSPTKAAQWARKGLLIQKIQNGPSTIQNDQAAKEQLVFTHSKDDATPQVLGTFPLSNILVPKDQIATTQKLL